MKENSLEMGMHIRSFFSSRATLTEKVKVLLEVLRYGVQNSKICFRNKLQIRVSDHTACVIHTGHSHQLSSVFSDVGQFLFLSPVLLR